MNPISHPRPACTPALRPLRLLPLLALVAAALIAPGCVGAATRVHERPARVHLKALPGSFDNPVWAGAPRGDSRLFVVERAGVIKVVQRGKAHVFLDIRDRVNAGGEEQGLLSMEFHPGFAHNGRFFVYYTGANGDAHVVEFAGRGRRANKASARTIIDIGLDPQFQNHNGGMVKMGPDGLLYIGVGDGGSAGDPDNHAQNPTLLMGKLLRIDVDHGAPYSIPDGNPFKGHAGGWRGEIYAVGMRNPWRFSFDRANRDLWIGDVGQGDREEVDLVRSNRAPAGGLNFGWRHYEGTRVYDAGTALLAGTTYRPPVAQYTHADGCSITGGFVYRGAAYPALRGTYVYADYCSSWLAGVDRGGRRRFKRDVGVSGISSFGETGSGELVATSLGTGKVYQLVG